MCMYVYRTVVSVTLEYEAFAVHIKHQMTCNGLDFSMACTR